MFVNESDYLLKLVVVKNLS